MALWSAQRVLAQWLVRDVAARSVALCEVAR
jgi:hypothetical protein